MLGAWLPVVSCCLAVALGAVQVPSPIAVTVTPTALLLAVLSYLRPRRAVRSCHVDQTGGIALIRRNVTIPFDLTQYRYVRMYSSRTPSMTSYPSMLVLYRDTQPSMWTWLGSLLFPRVDDERVVVLFNRWWDADGYFVAPQDLAALFHQACARAGRTPTQTHGVGTPGWEVRAEMSVF
jgi:hypothetical protein